MLKRKMGEQREKYGGDDTGFKHRGWKLPITGSPSAAQFAGIIPPTSTSTETEMKKSSSMIITGGGGETQCTVREQDRFMPIANVIRIMRKVLPAHAKISDDAKETIQECVSEYISFITSEANDRCQQEQRKTITADDLLWAMTKLGFDDYVAPLTAYLRRYRDLEGDHRGRASSGPLPPSRHGNVQFAVAAGLYGFAPPPAVASYIPAAAMAHQQIQIGGYAGDVDDGVVGSIIWEGFMVKRRRNLLRRRRETMIHMRPGLGFDN